MMLGARNMYHPFTETQWQELEHQALIFKYISSGVPIPPDLIYTVKKSLDSSLPANLFSHQPGGWGCFQVGFGRRADPEPDRCRRTDGKKWRCSKEVYPDSKYCERHMHRSKNRSRKPVEVITTPNTTTTAATTSTTSSFSLLPLSSASSSSSVASDQTYPHFHPYHNTTPLYPFPYPHSSSSSQNNTTHQMFLDSASYSQADHKDYRYFNGMRVGLDERAFFSETSGTLRSLPESYTTLTNSSSNGYSQFQSLGTENSKQQEKQCFVLGNDFKSTRPIKTERGHNDGDETQNQMHHFFNEKWPQKDRRDSWLDLEDDPSTHSSLSTTQLSMKLPMSSHHDLVSPNSRLHHDS